MSKESNNLRLLGSPVNLTYRSKKREDKKNVKNRPRSALQNSCAPEKDQERFKRPFSADTKDRAPSTRSFLKSFSADLLQSYNNSPLSVKVLPPTEELLANSKVYLDPAINNTAISSNASDYGSEDTFISLGSKIKAKAQSGVKNRNIGTKHFLKYRSLGKKGRKAMDSSLSEIGLGGTNNSYGVEVTIKEKSQRPTSPIRNKDLFQLRSVTPQFKTGMSYESYFLSLNGDIKNEDVAGRVSFAPPNNEAKSSIDAYSRHLFLTKQQLSLVEEESTQDLDSIPSQNNMVSLSPRNYDSIENQQVNSKENLDVIDYEEHDQIDNFKKQSNFFMNDTKNYSSFYNNIHANIDPYKAIMSSTGIHTDTSSKDSGYPESCMKEDKAMASNYSLPTTSVKQDCNTHDQPKSLEILNEKDYENCQNDKKWVEPFNHSRLLYKDFFLKKESHLLVPPQNSPTKSDMHIPGSSESASETAATEKANLEYPTYLLNSTTKAYTSRVIEDYKKELQAINNLHELTLKDIKTDAISPTPLNIDELFEHHSNKISDENRDSSENSQKSLTLSDPVSDKNSLDVKRDSISKVTTKELIQNYLKIKGDYTKEGKMLKKYDKKLNNMNSKAEESTGYKQFWNNRNAKNNIDKSNTPVNVRNQAFTMRAPSSARIAGVQNDKDIDSWMSLSAPSPRVLDVDNLGAASEVHQSKTMDPVKADSPSVEEISQSPSAPVETPKPTELNSKSTVLDIYSMLKEIESYGDNPVTSVSNVNVCNEEEVKDKERCPTPKDNFMEIFEFLEKVEQSANVALSVVTNTTPQTIPKLEGLLKLPHTELAQRLVTASLQLEERSCCIALLQESLANHKEQMISKVSNLEKQSHRNIAKVKQECEESIKRHQSFIDQLINDKKTLNHRIEQLVDERRSLEDRWKRSAQALEERYKLELRNQHDKMAAAQQVARQRWVRQKAEKIKELTVKGLEGELREMAERQQKEVSDLKMAHAEQTGRLNAKHAAELEELRRNLEQEKEAALLKERQLASSRMEKQILELEISYQEQRTRLIAEMRAENERVAADLAEKEKMQKLEFEKLKTEQERLLKENRQQMAHDIAKEREELEDKLKQKREELLIEFEQYKKDYEAEQQLVLKKKVTEITAQHKLERDREIEKAIESMDAEAQAGRKELQEALRRNKEQYEAELKELAETEQATLKRYQDAQARIRHTEDRCAELEMAIGQLETRNRVLTEKNTQLESRAEEVRASCEASWRGKVDSLQKEIEDMKKTHEEQMHQLYAKVKVAVARKDSTIQALTRETAKYQEKLTLLEQKLQQQRKDFLKSK
ncbi:centrosomal protein of 131 kDa [Pararge aegeria]|uniref:centrosomal protein of 131 kDa n=1 Tax=Pararge aegeria TaxID=116150 RepID=UPI0019D278C2|nr:centrosomal protein of 131 kDa [Pararge aegeria]XP_039753597.1 centrosomal protein of 131 kDa [Pararge aegeria]